MTADSTWRPPVADRDRCMQPTQGRPVIVLCLLAVAALAGVPSARAQGELEWRQFNVPGGDTFIRRTSQSVLPVNPHAHIDLLKYRIGTWAPTNPDTDLFAGVFDLSTGRYARFDLVFDGLVSPPGSYGDDACDPLQYGDNPLYAVVEFDVDGNTRTGGELARCQDYFLGNCGRFGFRALGAAGYPRPHRGRPGRYRAHIRRRSASPIHWRGLRVAARRAARDANREARRRLGERLWTRWPMGAVRPLLQPRTRL